ncbi:MAG: ethanolamine ammonia-lyase subunit EutC [Planctomycetes bacterium]|nr:ethanolamine ammonia-lyase subunit EutC [Planctomycetota bacterium]
MSYQAVIRGQRFHFADLRELLAKANEEKSGDQLAGLAATSQRERVAARWALADVPLHTFVDQPVVAPDGDEVSRLILDRYDQRAFAAIRTLTVGEFRNLILASPADSAEICNLQRAITPEMAAAVAKLMSNQDLILAASRIRNVSRLRNTLGQRGVLAVRVQPNHPADDLAGILLSAVDGLLFGCGDAVIGVNPAAESVDSVEAVLRGLDRLITTLGVPTQACCLAHISTQLACLERGAPVDLLFQSIAGTQGANDSFGVNLALLGEGRERVLEEHRRRGIPWVGEDVMYFETGQGSALSAGAHQGVDQVTLEARAYGIAREFSPLLVNTVVGFIGPEYLYDERQITRAGLEDHFMGKLLGLPMGCDVCYTNHAAADQNSADNLLALLTAAGCNYFMGVPCADDVMLHYQSTSFHDTAAMRELFGLRPAPEFEAWLEARGLMRDGRRLLPDDRNRRPWLATIESVVAGREPANLPALTTTPPAVPSSAIRASRAIELPADLGARTPARIFTGSSGTSYPSTVQLELREDHAAALDAVRDEIDIARDFGGELSERFGLFEVSSAARTKHEYLLRPDLGRSLSESGRTLLVEHCQRGATIQVVIGDGLSAAAVRRQIPALLPALMNEFTSRRWTTGPVCFVRHARVGLMNEIGALVEPEVVLLLIGERPGLATAESLSAYLAYRPRPGHTDARRNLISNIHQRGIPCEVAAVRIARLIEQLLAAQQSGIAVKESLAAPAAAITNAPRAS